MLSGSAPMQPVTITLPLAAKASPIDASDSSLALSRKPQGFTTTRSAPSCWRDSSYPSARRRVMMRSESTSALGQPRETKLIFGAGAESAAGAGLRTVSVDMGPGASRDRWRYQGIEHSGRLILLSLAKDSGARAMKLLL